MKAMKMNVQLLGVLVVLILNVASGSNTNVQRQKELVLPRFASTSHEETRWRRSTSGDFEFPEQLTFSVDVNNATVIIALQLSHVNNVNPPLYEFVDGKITEIQTDGIQNQALYQDVHTGAAYRVSCDDPTQQQCSLHGSFYSQQNKYSMTPHMSFQTSGLHEIDEIEEEEQTFDNDTPLPPESARNENRRPDSERKKRDIADQIRSKRNSENVNIVEFLAFADESVYQKFRPRYDSDSSTLTAIQLYFAFLINEIDLHYLSVPMVDPSLHIRVALTGVVIATSPNGAPWSAENTVVRDGVTYLNGSNALLSFTSWRNYYRSRFPNHDHAMAFTMKAFEFVYEDSQSNGLAGVAYRGQVCRSWDTSITEDNGKRTATIAAHELGHSLGATHDVTNTCPFSRLNIMTPSIRSTVSEEYAENQWTFSSCSVEDFNNHIDRLLTNCMQEHSMDISGISDDSPRRLPGEFYTLDEQCQMIYGPDSRSCETIVPAEGCHEGIRCDSSGCGYGYYTPYYVLAGTPCGNPLDKTWCYKGKCVPKPTQPTPSSTSSPTTSLPTTSSSTAVPDTSSTTSPTTSAPSSSSQAPDTTSTTIKSPTLTSTQSPDTNSTSVPTTSTSVPTTSTSKPTNSTLVPTTSTSKPTNSTSVPSTSTSVPTTSTSKPTNSTSIPTNSTSVPTTSTTRITTSPSTTTHECPISTSTTASTTTIATTTTPGLNFCKARCCRKRGRRKKCCFGKRCCYRRWGRNMPCCKRCKNGGNN